MWLLDALAWLVGAFVGLIGSALTLVTASFVLDRIRTPSRGVGVLWASLAPWSAPSCLVILIAGWMFARRGSRVRRRLGAVAMVVAVTALAMIAWWIAPFYVGARAAGPADLTVMELNLRYGGADAGEVVATARTRGVDLLVLTEITPAALQRLDRAGLAAELPYSLGRPRSAQNGSMAFSRYPLRHVHDLPVSRGGYTALVAGPHPFTLVAAHVDQPVYPGYGWAHDLATLRRVVAGLTGPRILVGDLNGSVDVGQIRALLRDGHLSDAAQQARAGWQPTWPGRIGHWPWTAIGIAAIDHVLVSSAFGVVGTGTVPIDGSDHLALIARLAVR